MELSTTMPTAKAIPASMTTFSVRPRAVTTRNDPTTEMPIPDSVHRDACGERMIGVDKPARQPQTVWRKPRATANRPDIMAKLNISPSLTKGMNKKGER